MNNSTNQFLIFLFFGFFTIKSGQCQKNYWQGSELISVPLITNFSAEDYNGGIQNWSIDQDTTGYIYVANNYGLLEFDGANWSRYEVEGGTKSRCVAIQKSTNNIFLGGHRQLGYFYYEKSGIKYVDLIPKIPPNIPFDEVWDLLEFENHIFANVGSHLLLIKNDSIIDLKKEDLEFLSMMNGAPIFGSKKGLFKYDTTSKRFNLLTNTFNLSYRGAIEQETDLIAFGYNGKISKFVYGQKEHLSHHSTDLLSNSKINKVLKLRDGRIAVGTQNNGLVILSKELKVLAHFTKNKGLNHRTVLSLFEDNFNNLWVGLNNGISVIELGSPFSLINEDVNLQGTGYAALSFDNKSYLGTSNGLFVSSTEGTADHYKLVQGSEGLVNNISIVNGTMILNHHEGFFSILGEQATPFFDLTGAWKMESMGPNKLIGGTYNGFYEFTLSKSEPINPAKIEGLDESSRIFEYENDTTLWMTHGYKGAYKIIIRNDSIYSVKQYGNKDGFPSNILISVYKISDELVFTAERGVYKYDLSTDRFKPHPFLSDLFSESHVSKLVQDGEKKIYFIENGSVGVLERTSIGIYEKKSRSFRKINKYLSDDLENISVMANHEIVFGAKEGFVKYDPLLDREEKKSFKTYLKDVIIYSENDSTRRIVGNQFESSSFTPPRSIQFTFSSPFFDGINHMEYSYRLFPYEENWSEWTSSNWKEYTNLPPQSYTFQIKSKNVYGEESVISHYRFSIKPKWYASNIAYGFLIGITLFLFSTIILYREKKHKADKKHIHLSKDELIKSKDQEISEFSAKTNLQIQSLKSESLKKEIDLKNSQLASVTMHLLSKNEFVSSIRKKINEAIESKDRESLVSIVKSIDKNIDEEQAWETFEHYFDQVHTNFLKQIQSKIHLTPQETKLCAYLKMNMSTKDIANLMNITVRGVELARYRLRKKLNIPRETNLSSHLEHIANE